MKQYVAAMDIGTSGCKSIIVDDEGQVVSSVIEEWYYVKKKYKLNVDFFVELIPSYFSGFSYHVFQIF